MSLLDAVFTHRDLTSDSDPRYSKIDRFFMHHATNTSVWATVELSKPGGRTVSMNAALGNGLVVETVPANRRAWTSASELDDRAYTVEVSNASIGGDWPIASPDYHNAARLLAAVATEHGFPIDDDHVLTHRELWLRLGESYPTECAGPWFQARKDAFLALARKYQAELKGSTTPTKPKEIKVKTYHREDKTARSVGRTVQPGQAFHLHTETGMKAGYASNVVGGVGPYSITGHVYADGKPGDVVEVKLSFQKNGVNSYHYEQRCTIDKDGKLRENFEFKRYVESGTAVHVRLFAPATNAGPVKVTVLDSDAYLFSVA